MDSNFKDRERRRQTRLEHFGTDNPTCPCCGQRDDRCFEMHHIAGRHFDQATKFPVCASCHRKVSDMQKDHPKQIQTPPCLDERLAHFMHGLADLLELVIEKLREFASDLMERARVGGSLKVVSVS
jgi:hypothetical protein